MMDSDPWRAPYAVVGIGIVLLGMAGLLSRVGAGWSFLVLALGAVALPYAFSETLGAAILPLLVGATLVVVAGLALAVDVRHWFSVLTGIAGVASFAVVAAVELPRARHEGWTHHGPPPQSRPEARAQRLARPSA